MKLNALWWWIDRWRKSTAYTDMTLEEQGAYRNLLDEAHLRGGALPKDERILAKACGDMLAWKRVRRAVMARFREGADGLHNETLDEVLGQSVKRASRQQAYRNARRNAPHNSGHNEAHSPSPSPSQRNNEKESRQEAEPPRVPPPANPLVDRRAMESRFYELVRAIAPRVDLDPTEVARKVTAWKGGSYVRADTMLDDRLAHSVATLEHWLRKLDGKTEPEVPEARAAANPRAKERVEGMTAMIGGGLRDDGRRLGGGNKAARGRLAGPRSGAGGDGDQG